MSIVILAATLLASSMSSATIRGRQVALRDEDGCLFTEGDALCARGDSPRRQYVNPPPLVRITGAE